MYHGLFIALLGEIKLLEKFVCISVCVYILDIFIHMKYVSVLLRYVFCSNLNSSPKPVRSPPGWLVPALGRNSVVTP